jgi:hypothetical protein
MRSTPGERLARIGRAIDELAADSLAPRGAGPDASMHARLARIWDMVAELDPELARRVPDYRRRPGSAQDAGADAAETSGTADAAGAGGTTAAAGTAEVTGTGPPGHPGDVTAVIRHPGAPQRETGRLS